MLTIPPSRVRLAASRRCRPSPSPELERPDRVRVVGEIARPEGTGVLVAELEQPAREVLVDQRGEGGADEHSVRICGEQAPVRAVAERESIFGVVEGEGVLDGLDRAQQAIAGEALGGLPRACAR